jgi:hypothetical protein
VEVPSVGITVVPDTATDVDVDVVVFVVVPLAVTVEAQAVLEKLFTA